MTVRVDGSGTAATSFYNIWKAATVASEMCGRRGQKAAIVNVGSSSRYDMSRSQIDCRFRRTRKIEDKSLPTEFMTILEESRRSV